MAWRDSDVFFLPLPVATLAAGAWGMQAMGAVLGGQAGAGLQSTGRTGPTLSVAARAGYGVVQHPTRTLTAPTLGDGAKEPAGRAGAPATVSIE